MKKYILGLVFAVLAPIALVYAATPVLTATGTGDNNNVTVQVTGGDSNAPVVLFYNGAIGSNVQQANLGNTDVNGFFSGTVSTNSLGINGNVPVYVQVGGFQSSPVSWPVNAASSTSTAGGITFSPGAPNFALGQNGTITLSGGAGGFFVSANSNPNFTTASINGNILTVSGSQTGTTNITVCSSSSSNCGVISVSFGNVTSTGVTTGNTTNPTLSQGAINVNTGGQTSITVTGGTAPYFVSIPTGSGITTTLVGNTLTINGGNTAGTGVIQVCSANTTSFSTIQCTPLTVTVGGSTITTPTPTTVVPSTSGGVMVTFPLSVGQTSQFALSGGTGSFFLQSAPTTPVSASINGNLLTLSGTAVGQTTLSVCSTGATTVCTPIGVSVSSATFPNTGTGGGFFFETDLSRGMSGQDVMELQNRLKDEGFFNATATGFYGPITAASVSAYQTAHGITANGIAGPATRAELNK